MWKLIIVGCDQIGRTFLTNWKDRRYKLAAIDIREHALRKLLAITPVEIFKGDGSDTEVLIKTGIEDCSILIALTGDDHVNLFSSLVAKKIYQVKKVICRLNNQAHQVLFKDHQLLFINPAEAFAEKIRDTLREGVKLE